MPDKLDIPADVAAAARALTDLRPTPLKNFAPRIGLAYRFTEKTVIRAAFGLAYDPAYPDDKWAFNYPVKQNNAFNAANSYSAAGSIAAGFPAPLPVVIPDSGVIPNAPAQNYISLPPDLRQGHLNTWNIALQRQLPGSFAFEAAYVGNYTVGTLNNVNINAGQVPGQGAAGQPLNIKFGLRSAGTCARASIFSFLRFPPHSWFAPSVRIAEESAGTIRESDPALLSAVTARTGHGSSPRAQQGKRQTPVLARPAPRFSTGPC